MTNISGTSGGISVQPNVATQLTLSGPPTGPTAGTNAVITVQALDQFGNIATNYSGTVHFTSSDKQALLPANSTLTGGVGVFSTTLETAGNQTLTATDTLSSSLKTPFYLIFVVAAAPTHFGFLGTPSAIAAGTVFRFTVAALDSFGNIANAYLGTVHFSSNDTKAVLPQDATLTTGVGTFSATLASAGTLTLTATDDAASSIAGTSTGIIVSADAASQFVVIAPPTATAGAAATVTVIAEDRFGNFATNYQGTIHFTSTDPSAVLPINAVLAGGQGTFNVTLKTALSQTVSVADVALSAIAGTSQPILVSPLAATHFGVIAPATFTAGNLAVFTVTALDPFNNTATSYVGTVHFSSTDGQALLSTDKTLTNGVGLFGVSLRTAGNQTITATDTSASSESGSSNAIAVSAGAVSRFQVSGPAGALSTVSFPVTVTAQDAFGNTVAGYAGNLHITSSDAAAVLPATGTVSGGTGTFTVTLKTTGSQTIAVSDTATGSLTGVFTVAVAAGPVTHFVVSSVSSTAAGTPFVFEVTAFDALNNLAANYTGTVHFSSTDSQAGLPVNATLTAGFGVFAAVLRTAGNQTLTVADSVNTGVTGTTTAITVSALAVNHFLVSAPATAITGGIVSFTVLAKDPFNNTIAGYKGTIHFTSSDPSAILPANTTLAGGAGAFSAVFNSLGSQTLTATDVASGTIAGASNVIDAIGLRVTSLTPTSTGFIASFNKPFLPSLINLYDESGTFGPDDVLLTGPSAPQISFHGSLLISANDQTITFVKTSNFLGSSFNPATGVLAAGTYTVTFRSASNGFSDALADPLDGAGTGNPAGNNYTATFVVAAPPVVVGVPSFARGPDSVDAINLPNSGTAGIPLNLSVGSGVTAGTFTLEYNSALLSITAAAVNSALTGASLSLDAASSPGMAIIDFTSPTALTQLAWSAWAGWRPRSPTPLPRSTNPKRCCISALSRSTAAPSPWSATTPCRWWPISATPRVSAPSTPATGRRFRAWTPAWTPMPLAAPSAASGPSRWSTRPSSPISTTTASSTPPTSPC